MDHRHSHTSCVLSELAPLAPCWPFCVCFFLLALCSCYVIHVLCVYPNGMCSCLRTSPVTCHFLSLLTALHFSVLTCFSLCVCAFKPCGFLCPLSVWLTFDLFCLPLTAFYFYEQFIFWLSHLPRMLCFGSSPLIPDRLTEQRSFGERIRTVTLGKVIK